MENVVPLLKKSALGCRSIVLNGGDNTNRGTVGEVLGTANLYHFIFYITSITRFSYKRGRVEKYFTPQGGVT